MSASKPSRISPLAFAVHGLAPIVAFTLMTAGSRAAVTWTQRTLERSRVVDSTDNSCHPGGTDVLSTDIAAIVSDAPAFACTRLGAGCTGSAYAEGAGAVTSGIVGPMIVSMDLAAMTSAHAPAYGCGAGFRLEYVDAIRFRVSVPTTYTLTIDSLHVGYNAGPNPVGRVRLGTTASASLTVNTPTNASFSQMYTGTLQPNSVLDWQIKGEVYQRATASQSQVPQPDDRPEATGHGHIRVRLVLGCQADFNGSGSPSVQDIFDFLMAWFAGNPSADVNGGGLAVSDIFDFLTLWFAGC